MRQSYFLRIFFLGTQLDIDLYKLFLNRKNHFSRFKNCCLFIFSYWHWSCPVDDDYHLSNIFWFNDFFLFMLFSCSVFSIVLDALTFFQSNCVINLHSIDVGFCIFIYQFSLLISSYTYYSLLQFHICLMSNAVSSNFIQILKFSLDACSWFVEIFYCIEIILSSSLFLLRSST